MYVYVITCVETHLFFNVEGYLSVTPKQWDYQILVRRRYLRGKMRVKLQTKLKSLGKVEEKTWPVELPRGRAQSLVSTPSTSPGSVMGWYQHTL